MKRIATLLLTAALVLGLAAPAMAADSAPVVILHTNDVHTSTDGYAAVAAYRAEMEKQYGSDRVTLVDAGDAIQGGPIGTLTKGASLVDIMNEVGYDFAIPGNHEFDYGMDVLLDLARSRAQYTYLSWTGMGTPYLPPMWWKITETYRWPMWASPPRRR